MASTIRLLAQMREVENSFLTIFFEYTSKIAELTQSKLFVVMETSNGIRRIGGNKELKQAFLSGTLSYCQGDVVMDEQGSGPNRHFHGNDLLEEDLSNSAKHFGPGPEAAKGAEVEFVLEAVKLESLEDQIVEDELPLRTEDDQKYEAAEDQDEAAEDQEDGKQYFAKIEDGGLRGAKHSGRKRKGKGTERNTEKEECILEKLVMEEKRGGMKWHEKYLMDGEQNEGRGEVKPRNKGPGVCPLCGKSFARRCHVLRHVNHVHYGLRPFPCLEKGCDYVGKTKFDLKKHCLRQHKTLGSFPRPEKRVQCLEDEIRFKSTLPNSKKSNNSVTPH